MSKNTEEVIAAAKIHVHKGNLAEAESLLSEFSQHDSVNEQGLSLLLNVLLAMEKWPKALKIVDILEPLSVNRHDIYLYRAVILAELNRTEEALEAMSHVTYAGISENKRTLWLHTQLNKLNQISEGFSVAEKHFDDLSNDALKILLQTGCDSNRTELARRCGERLIAAGEDNVNVRFNLYKVEILSGHAEAARSHLDTFLVEQNNLHKKALEQNLSELDKALFAFIHIPKTGGTSTKEAIDKKGIDLNHRALKSHGGVPPERYYDFYPPYFVDIDDLKGKPLVTNVRNIFSFLVSYYLDAKRVILFDFLVEDSIAANRYNFRDFVKYLSEKSGGWVCNDLIYFHCFAQPTGELAVDWINRLETLDADMNAFFDLRGVNSEFSIEHLNKKLNRDYRHYYDDRSAELVSRTWADDIRLFGFQFDGGYSEDALLHRDVSQWKNRIRYSLEDNQLEVK